MTVAQGWLVFDLTGSPLYLGYVGLATAGPGIFLSLLGGVLADRVDLRRLLVVTQLVVAGLAASLATVTALGIVQPWHVLIIAFLTGSAQALNNPARQAIFPQLIDRKDLMNAVSLNAMVWQGTRIVAPAGGGVLVAVAGSATTFYACAVGYLIFSAIVLSLKVRPVEKRPRGNLMGDMTEGLRYVGKNSLFAFLIGLMFCNSFFGLSLIHIMPVFARDILDVGPSGLGLMFSAMGSGSVLGLVLASTLGNKERKGLIIIGGAVLYGLFLILFSFSTMFALSLALLFIMGIFNQIYMISVQTILQLRVPDELRGRVMGIYTMTFNLGPLGAIQAGALASVFSPGIAVLIGGSVIIFFAASVAMTKKEIRQLRTEATA